MGYGCGSWQTLVLWLVCKCSSGGSVGARLDRHLPCDDSAVAGQPLTVVVDDKVFNRESDSSILATPLPCDVSSPACQPLLFIVDDKVFNRGSDSSILATPFAHGDSSTAS